MTYLIAIVQGVVRNGASVGWMEEPSTHEARRYWESVIEPGTVLLLALLDETLVGTAQLELAQRKNGSHRAEVSKVLVNPDFQGRGFGRELMAAVEAHARSLGRTLLHLDTNEDDTTNEFYRRLGWIPAGTIPEWARSGSDNELHGTTFYYKLLS